MKDGNLTSLVDIGVEHLTQYGRVKGGKEPGGHQETTLFFVMRLVKKALESFVLCL